MLKECKSYTAHDVIAEDPGHIPAGFYLVQQRHGGRVYVGQAQFMRFIASQFDMFVAK